MSNKAKEKQDGGIKAPGEQKLTLAQSLGITKTVKRTEEETDIRKRPDRIGKYFKKYLNKFVFVEFSDEYLNGSKVKDIMKGVPVPLRRRDVKEFAGGKGLKATHIAENMAWIMGCDPKFKYNQAYIDYMFKLFNYKIYEGMMKEGRDAAEIEDYDNACIHFRASLCMKPDYLHGMYSYARVCRAMYMNSGNTEYVGRFKAEALDYFELVTETHPRFAQGYYYLGYAYLNIGLYGKAFAAWKWFLKFTRSGRDRKEINNRIKQIEDPMRIEEGYSEILAGRYDQGVDILEDYLDSQYKDWWPLHYYLGVGYSRLGKQGDAFARFKHTLSLNGSHLETMEELATIYESQGDKENTNKYRKKIELIKADIAKEQEAMEKAREKESGSEIVYLEEKTKKRKEKTETKPRERKKEKPEETKEKDAGQKQEKKKSGRPKRLDKK